MRCFRGGMKLSAAILGLALWPCASLLAQDYEIHLHRPQAVGQKYHLSATGESIQTLVEKSGGKVLKNDTDKFSVACECTVIVLGVDDKGKPSKLSLEIEKLIRTDDAGPKELASQGNIVAVSMKDGAEISEMNGHPLPLPAQQAITVIFPLAPYGPTEDELYGTAERKNPGDHWGANTGLMVQALLRSKATAKKEDIRGTVTFEKLVKVGKTDCLQISGSMDCAKYLPYVSRDVNVEKGFLKIGFSETLPVAASVPPLELAMSTNVGYTVKGRPDPSADEVTMEVGGELTSLSRVTDVQEPLEGAPK